MQTFGPRAGLAFVFLPFVAAAVLAGCATTSNEVAPALLTCDELAAEMASTRDARLQAIEKKEDAWKFVIPFAVAGRHVASAQSVSEADRVLGELDEQAHAKGCTAHG